MPCKPGNIQYSLMDVNKKPLISKLIRKVEKTGRPKTCDKTEQLSYRLYVFFPLLNNLVSEIVLNIKEENIMQ